MIRIAKRLAVLGASLAVCLVALEIALRVRVRGRDAGTLETAFAREWPVPEKGEAQLAHIIELSEDPRIVYRLRKNLRRVRFVGKPLSTSSLGFRGPELPPAEANTRTIVGLGDSVMFGSGVTDSETYLRILEAELSSRFPGLLWRAINTGVNGYNTVMEVATLERWAPELQPDVVVLGLVTNDLGLPNFIRIEEDVFSLQKSFLAELVLERWGGESGDVPEGEWVDREWRLTEDPEQVPEAYRWMVGWEPFREALDRLAELSRRDGFEVIAFVTRPNQRTKAMLDEAAARGFRTFHIGERIRRYLTEHGIEDYAGSELVVGEKDPHPSAIQHRIIAEALLEVLEELDSFER